MRNVEVKAKVSDIKHILAKAKKLAGNEGTVMRQHDTFYNAPNGRLKLRRLLDTGNGELIFYDRPDTDGPKLSSFEKAHIDSQSLSSLSNVLEKALNAKSDVKKTRHLFLVDQTKIHIDQVENLGDFMELEVCLRPEQTLEEGQLLVQDFMNKLDVKEEDLISGAYADLLNKL